MITEQKGCELVRDSFFFFSSRRRHTRLQGDWSSDVCSSDLAFEVSDNDNDSLAQLLRTASARAGWLAIIRALEGRRVKDPAGASRSRLPQKIGRASCRERV